MKMKLLSILILSLFVLIPLHAEDGDHKDGDKDGIHQDAENKKTKSKNINSKGVCEMPDGTIVDIGSTAAKSASSGGGEGAGEEYYTSSEPNNPAGGGDGQAVIDAKCNSCHGPGKSQGPFSSMQAAANRVQGIGGAKMPPGGGLSDSEINAIKALAGTL